MAQCYPKLKDYCREKHGLEFQVEFRFIRKKNNVALKQATRTAVHIY